jgi:hypothetical protein
MQQTPYPPPYTSRPPKDRSVALILEILPGLFGFLGFGWIYSNQTTTGVLWLVGVIFWDLIAIGIVALTAGFGCFCTIPINIVLVATSTILLNNHIKQHPELFGQV